MAWLVNIINRAIAFRSSNNISSEQGAAVRYILIYSCLRLHVSCGHSISGQYRLR